MSIRDGRSNRWGRERSAKPHKKQLKISTVSPQNGDIKVIGGSLRGVLLKNTVLSTGYEKFTAVRTASPLHTSTMGRKDNTTEGWGGDVKRTWEDQEGLGIKNRN